MRYYSLHPFKPQYFFPKDFNKHKVFLSFYQPYSLVGCISWWVFRYVSVFRHFLGKNNIEFFVPEKEIRKQTGHFATMAFNAGTHGAEQKITALGFENNTYFFIKYAQTPLAAINVTNEYEILRQLKTLDNVPLVLDFKEINSKVLLKTSVLQGERFSARIITGNLVQTLFTLANLSVKTTNIRDKKLKTSFAHGDFCPWNMMESEGKILLFDWEMAASYPIGYDLFTFIFQTNFLLHPEKNIEILLKENVNNIICFFNHFYILNWHEYLAAFAEIKLDINQRKGKNSLFTKYQSLLTYAQKT